MGGSSISSSLAAALRIYDLDQSKAQVVADLIQRIRPQVVVLEILSGYELFFYQGVDAFEIFTGVPVDEARLRAVL